MPPFGRPEVTEEDHPALVIIPDVHHSVAADISFATDKERHLWSSNASFDILNIKIDQRVARHLMGAWKAHRPKML